MATFCKKNDDIYYYRTWTKNGELLLSFIKHEEEEMIQILPNIILNRTTLQKKKK